MIFLVFMIIASLVLLVAYAMRLNWMYFNAGRWFWAVRIWEFSLWVGWMNETTITNYRQLAVRERKKGYTVP